MIAPVGLELERVREGIRNFPVNVVYVISSAKRKGSRLDSIITKEAKCFADKLYCELEESGYYEVNRLEIDVTHIQDCISALKTIIDNEIQHKKVEKIFINTSNSSKAMALACLYLASLYNPQVNLFYVRAGKYLIFELLELIREIDGTERLEKDLLMKIKKFLKDYNENGWTKPAYEIEELPNLPIKSFSETQIKILNSLSYKNPNFPSIQALIENLGETTTHKVRMRLKYALDELEELNLIKIQRDHRKKTVHLTDIGKLFAATLLPLN